MNIFGIGRKKKRKKRQLTEEQKLHKVELKIKKYAGKALLEMAENDPEIKRQLVAETFDIKLPDSYGEPERKLKALIGDLVIQKIESEPEVARKITDAKIYQVMRAEGLTPDSEEALNRPSPIRQQITRFREINELKETLGIKEPGFFDIFKDPEVIKAVLQLISAAFGGGDSPQVKEEMVLVQIKNRVETISKSEFKRLQSEGRIQKTGEGKSTGLDIPKINEDSSQELNTPDKTEGDNGPLQS